MAGPFPKLKGLLGHVVMVIDHIIKRHALASSSLAVTTALSSTYISKDR